MDFQDLWQTQHSCSGKSAWHQGCKILCARRTRKKEIHRRFNEYLQQIQKDYQENLKYINFSINELIGEYVYGIFAIQKEHSDLHVHHLKLKPSWKQHGKWQK